MEMDSQKDEVSKLEKELADIEHKLKLERDRDEGIDVIHLTEIQVVVFYNLLFPFRAEEIGE